MSTSLRRLAERAVYLAVTHRFGPASGETLAPGTSGIVRWDEGGEEVIVEFDRSVPNSGFALPDRQAWVSRSSLMISRSRI